MAVGFGDDPSATMLDAMLWRKIGGKWHMTDLGTLAGCSTAATSINASGQVLGYSPCAGVNGLAFLWEDGGPMVDLNTLVPPNSGIELYETGQINDRGEIAVNGLDANGNNHDILLIPCDENHPGVEGCDNSMVDASTAAKADRVHPEQTSSARPDNSRMSIGLRDGLRGPMLRHQSRFRSSVPR